MTTLQHPAVSLREAERLSTQVLVIGSGAAGLRAALAAAESGAEVLVLTKGRAEASGCTAFCDRGIEFSLITAPVGEGDSAALYEADLLACGSGRGNTEMVRCFAEGSLDEVRLLEELGAPLLRRNGGYKVVPLPGCSVARSIACGRDFGRALLKAVLGRARALNVEVRERSPALELLRDGTRITGAVAYDPDGQRLMQIAAGCTLLATGGFGRLFRPTTNPPQLTGDGLAMGLRRGAAAMDDGALQVNPLTIAPLKIIYLISSVMLAGRVSNVRGEFFEPDVPADTPQHLRSAMHLNQLGVWLDAQRAEGALTPAGGSYWGRHASGRRLL